VSDLPDHNAPKQVSFDTDDVTEDGGDVLLRMQTKRDGAINLAILTVDLQHLVTPLLMLGGS
jgi:hypothetical protein